MLKNKHYDVMVLGGGIVGLSLALALAKLELSVAVIERQIPDLKLAEKYERRVVAINRASEFIFSAIGAWPLIQHRVSPFNGMEVWDACGDGAIVFDSCAIGESRLGHIIENRVILAALWQQVQAHKNITLLCPSLPRRLQITLDKVYLTLEDENLTASLLVGADGGDSWVRQQAGLAIYEYSYSQQAIVTTVHTELSHEKVARQRFFAQGALAFLPLKEQNYCSIVLSINSTESQQWQALDTQAFNERLTELFAQRLGKVEACDARMLFPLQMRHAKSYVSPRIALIGDAAHTFHPLAGQGVNLGLLDAAYLANEISHELRAKRDIGNLSTLRRYERARKGHNWSMVAAMQGFKQLFNTELAPIVTMRNFGLNLVDKSDLLKNFFMRHAAGLRGDLPPLARRNFVDDSNVDIEVTDFLSLFEKSYLN